VSEYQYYEFRALDRRLTAEQRRRLRSLSSRAEISATRFTNEYSFGNFRGDPARLLEQYFDAYLYAANWGTRELAFRLPRALLDAETARQYCDEEYRAWVAETAARSKIVLVTAAGHVLVPAALAFGGFHDLHAPWRAP
jgi:hypothetical protein